jgi:hypothetical protein
MLAIICPSNRPTSLAAWWNAWREEFLTHDARMYVVWDDAQTWAEIDDRLGKDAWIISRQSSAIRSWGFLKAYWDGADYFITLDDDCLPHTTDFVDQHLAALNHLGGWMSTITGLRPRGMPILQGNQVVAVNHGLWTNVPDIDGETQLANPGPYHYGTPTQFMPAGMYFPMSGMNLAFTRKVAPLMWFGLQGAGPDGTPWGFDRYDDIWAGLFAKRVLDHCGLTVRSGTPLVHHARASDPVVNELKERSGRAVNEWLWRNVAAAYLTSRTPIEAYRNLAANLELPTEPYWRSVRAGMLAWAALIEKGA